MRKNKIKAEIVADSKNLQGHRITTFKLIFPRFILAELNTHRMFSKNSASSRAIPFKRMVQSVKDDPFIPIAWQKDHKGMQGTEYFGPTETFTSVNPMNRFANGITDKDSPTVIVVDRLKAEWLWARDMAVQAATNLNNSGVHYHPNSDTTKLTGDGRGLTKQICNRLLEPFMWHKVLLTATEFNNFFELRCPIYDFGTGTYRSWKDYCDGERDVRPNDNVYPDYTKPISERIQLSKSQAEIHIQVLAEAMWDAMNESTPKQLKDDEWHIPFEDKMDDEKICTHEKSENIRLKIATARCARISYQTLGDNPKIDYEADIKLHNMLLEHKHMSPFEHCAKAMNINEYSDYTKTYECNEDKHNLMGVKNVEKGWCRNFKGFIQYREIVEKK